jgi:predicted DNA-binding transcriptional regulator YafY
MSRDTNRAARLNQIQHQLHKHPQGLTTMELASICNTSRRTIQRDIQTLGTEMQIPVEEKGNDRYGILTDYILPPVAYSLYETLIFFLSLRLLVRQTDIANPYIQSSIGKIISLMPKPLAAQLNRSVQYMGQKPLHENDIEIFEKVAKAWVTQKRLRITYDSYHRQPNEEWFVDPYFMEMTGVGFSIYLIGYAESKMEIGLQTFKLNRIREAEILDENIENTHQIKMDELLSSAWGVMWGQNITVKLKFSAGVARRVKESFWHPSQQILDLPDGGCLFTVKVGSTLEMSPWIKGWGPEVEVLEPAELRDQFKGWAKRLGEMYLEQELEE